ALLEINIQCVGPTKDLAQIESSKGFTRDLMKKYNILGCPNYQIFHSLMGVPKFLKTLGDNYVVKFDGLMGGKGVKVSGEHVNSHKEAIEYCEQIIGDAGTFVIEEKLVGEEFSLMSFCDGDHLIHMPPVQDHKRAYENDTGPNTGGMGSYNDAYQTLPFLTTKDIDSAKAINIATAKALKEEFGVGYKGILYGGFIATADGIKVIEYNARFGDPEVMNVLSLLESDLIEICLGITNTTLNECDVKFSNKATVCKYVVPEGYPDSPIKGEFIDISKIKNPDQLYFASVDLENNTLLESGSRTIAVVGIADKLYEAEIIAEDEINRIKGPLFHRTDIGTAELVQKRINHMNTLRG
ncbi:MAG: phosphoribosylamine--glycine ligase, partial [Candidatus Marinimicrobia bacterium]|nr:phosphoribosylamine--glycine ligase [Candidatus Neomarinimicrobiota bacterium]